jgi:hypothetical protein
MMQIVIFAKMKRNPLNTFLVALYTSSLYTLSTSPKIRVFFKNIWFMSLSPNQEFTCPRRFCTFSQPQKMEKKIAVRNQRIAEFQLHWSTFEKLFEDC